MSPKQIELKIRQVLGAWKTLASNKVFGGMTLDQAEAKVQPSFDSRTEVAALETRLGEAINRRADNDAVSLNTLQTIVNAVVGDPNEGPDSPLYEAMGYTRKSERKTGLTRNKNKPPVQS